MKNTFIILFSLLFTLACKTKNKSEVKREKQKTVASKGLIPVFTITYDSLYLSQKDQVSSFNKKIENICVNAAKEHKYSFKGILGWYQKKNFQKVLARDFENERFMEIKKLLFSSIKVKMGNNLSSEIVIEEWVFENEETAKSCFESFNNYEERTIYFKSINWIWFLKGNKLFLLFSLDEPVEKKAMQLLKQRLMSFLEVNENHVKEVY